MCRIPISYPALFSTRLLVSRLIIYTPICIPTGGWQLVNFQQRERGRIDLEAAVRVEVGKRPLEVDVCGSEVSVRGKSIAGIFTCYG
jgi:hypothetical protein